MENNFFLGSHLFVECNGYSHHGIYIGDGRVIHFDSTPARKLLGSVKDAPPKVVDTTINEFSGGRTIHVRSYECEWLPAGSDDHQAVELAAKQLGQRGYDLFENNCEHFAVWCKTGTRRSTQIDSARRVVRTGAAGIAAGAAVARSARVLPPPYRVLAYGVSAALVVGGTVYRFVQERQQNRDLGRS